MCCLLSTKKSRWEIPSAHTLKVPWVREKCSLQSLSSSTDRLFLLSDQLVCWKEAGEVCLPSPLSFSRQLWATDPKEQRSPNEVYSEKRIDRVNVYYKHFVWQMSWSLSAVLACVWLTGQDNHIVLLPSCYWYTPQSYTTNSSAKSRSYLKRDAY